MLSKKNLIDYSWETEVAPNGKVVDKMVYKGPLFEWGVDSFQIKKITIKLVLCILISFTAFLSSLWNYSNITRIWYIILPYSVLSLMIGLNSSSIFLLSKVKNSFQRKQKEKIADRLKTIAVVELIVVILCLTTSMLYCTKQIKYMKMWDYYFICMLLVILISFFFIWIEARKLNPIQVN